MALAKLGSGFTSIGGKQGGVYYKQGPYGHHIQKMPRKVKRQPSALQYARWRAFMTCRRLARLPAVRYFQLEWMAYAYRHPVTNKKGERRILSWQGAFISVNINRVFYGLPALIRPPL